MWLQNLQRIEHLGYEDWMREHGAHERTVSSAIVRGVHGLVFHHQDPGAAGTALNGVLTACQRLTLQPRLIARSTSADAAPALADSVVGYGAFAVVGAD